MLSYTEHPPPRVLPVRALLLTLLACLGGSYWLVPSESEMVERLMLDQQYERVATLLNTETAGGSVSAFMVRQLDRDQLASLSQLLRLTPREQLNTIFSNTRPPAYDRLIHTLAMSAVRYVNVMPPEQAWPLISAHADRMSGRQFLEFATLLSNNALALRQPALAATILDRVSSLPEAGARTANDMAQAYRWSRQPGRGASRLHDWMQSHASTLSGEDAGALRTLNSALALEGGNPGLALDLCLDELRALPNNQSPSPDLMERALNLAYQSSRTRDLIPSLQRLVKAMPEAGMPLKQLHQLASDQPNRVAGFQKWATLLAHFADWDSDFETSFDQHLRLAATGSLESLDRCAALWNFLGGGQEMTDLLVELGDVPQRPKLKPLLAGLLASLGRDGEARPLYEQWLAVNPDDRDSHYSLACLLEDMGDEDACLAAFRSLVKRHPGDVPAVKKLADNEIRAGLFSEALHLYGHLREQDHDHFARENYAMLAESLDEHEELFKAQLLIANATNPPTADAYLDMAETSTYLPDPAKAIQAVEQGLARLPNSAAIRVALADIWTRDEDYGKAWAVLHHDCVKTSFDGVTRILDLAPDLPQQQECLAFLGKDLDKRFDLPPSARLDLAVLYALCGHRGGSEKLFASVPAAPATYDIIAQARFTIGGYEEAASLMERHIATKHLVTSDDHIFLGDLYELLGREADAQQAYAASIDVIASLPVLSDSRSPSPAPLAKQP